MFGYQFPTWVPVVFFIVLIASAIGVGLWLQKNDRNYKSKY